MNTVLKTNKYPTHNYEAYNYFIGSGTRNLVAKALPKNHENEIESYADLMTVYSNNCSNKTKPYDHIITLLDTLVDRKLKLCVLSNKSDALQKKIVSELFANYFETVVGLTTEELKTKSIYSTTNKQRIRVSPQEILYVGDSGIDMQTATNAGMGAVGVSWATDQKKNCLLMALFIL
jgi:phosphoglycolate phosphatase